MWFFLALTLWASGSKKKHMVVKVRSGILFGIMDCQLQKIPWVDRYTTVTKQKKYTMVVIICDFYSKSLILPFFIQKNTLPKLKSGVRP